MRQVRVKICGNTRKDDIECAIKAGADAIGLIIGFPSSPRNLDIDKAHNLITNIPSFIEKVVVVPQDDYSLLKTISRRLHVNSVQLIGETSYDPKIREIFKGMNLIKVIHVNNQDIIESVLEASALYNSILLDSKVGNSQGGTGVTHDWNLSRNIVNSIYSTPVILAGGLNVDNVERAIDTVKPYAVDVSSGVESRIGIKDHDKIKLFIEKAKRVRL